MNKENNTDNNYIIYTRLDNETLKEYLSSNKDKQDFMKQSLSSFVQEQESKEKPADFRHFSIFLDVLDKNVDFSGAKLTDCKLSSDIVTSSIKMDNVSLSDSILRNTEFQNDVTTVDFSGADISNCTFTEGKFNQNALKTAKFQVGQEPKVKMKNGEIQKININDISKMPMTSVIGVNTVSKDNDVFTVDKDYFQNNKDQKGIHMGTQIVKDEVNMNGVNFENATFSGVEFSNNLRKVGSLKGADISGCSFIEGKFNMEDLLQTTYMPKFTPRIETKKGNIVSIAEYFEKFTAEKEAALNPEKHKEQHDNNKSTIEKERGANNTVVTDEVKKISKEISNGDANRNNSTAKTETQNPKEESSAKNTNKIENTRFIDVIKEKIKEIYSTITKKYSDIAIKKDASLDISKNYKAQEKVTHPNALTTKGKDNNISPSNVTPEKSPVTDKNINKQNIRG